MSEHPYLRGFYRPTACETTAQLDEVVGEIPRDLHGVYVRNGPNPRHAARGRYHWFDGDGMVHAISLEDGRATYRSRFVRTRGFEAEEAAGKALYSGLLESTDSNPADQPYKDTGNTDVISHGGSLYALWYMSGAAHELDPVELTTVGPATFGRERPLRMSAHAKVDRHSDELLFFDYGPRRPYLSYGVISAQHKLVHRVDIDLPGPRLPHDMAFTEHHAILMDLPVYPRPEALQEKRWIVAYHHDQPARFGVIPRRGGGDSIRWFEAEPCYVYHSFNAWEEGDEVVMIGCRCSDPMPTIDPDDPPELARGLANLRLDARLHCWRFNLRDGSTREHALDDQNCEFPTMADAYLGRRSRFGYAMSIPKTSTLLFDGIVKYDLHDGSSDRLAFGEGCFGSEAPFAARASAASEDDGYLLSLVRTPEQSELWIVDAAEPSRGPLARVAIPVEVPLGFHACWVPPSELQRRRRQS